MAIHRIYIEPVDTVPLEAGPVHVSGEEAQHAIRVKRLKAGDPLEVLDGRGRVATGAIAGTDKDRAGWHLHVEIQSTRIVPAPAPRIEVYSPAPKGPRLSEMIDGLSQVGAAFWSPMSTALSVADPRATKLERMQRVATEASKQCGRPWLLQIGAGASLRSVLASRPAGEALVMADASGEAYIATGAPTVRLLIGPEGGWRDDELASARDLGIAIARFGPYAMRIETAAVVAAAIVLDAETRHR